MSESCVAIEACVGWVAAPSVSSDVFLKDRSALHVADWSTMPPLEDDDQLTGLYILARRGGLTITSSTGGTVSGEPKDLSLKELPLPSARAVHPTPLNSPDMLKSGGGDATYQLYFSTIDYSSLLDRAESKELHLATILEKERIARREAQRWKQAVLEATSIQKKQDLEIAQERSQLATERSAVVHGNDEAAERKREQLRAQVTKERRRAWEAWDVANRVEQEKGDVAAELASTRKIAQGLVSDAKHTASLADAARQSVATASKHVRDRQAEWTTAASHTLDLARSATRDNWAAMSRAMDASGPAFFRGENVSSVGLGALALIEQIASDSRVKTADELLRQATAIFAKAGEKRRDRLKEHRQRRLHEIAASSRDAAKELTERAEAYRLKAVAYRSVQAKTKAAQEHGQHDLALRLAGFERGRLGNFPRTPPGAAASPGNRGSNRQDNLTTAVQSQGLQSAHSSAHSSAKTLPGFAEDVFDNRASVPASEMLGDAIGDVMPTASSVLPMQPGVVQPKVAKALYKRSRLAPSDVLHAQALATQHAEEAHRLMAQAQALRAQAAAIRRNAAQQAQQADAAHAPVASNRRVAGVTPGSMGSMSPAESIMARSDVGIMPAY